LPELGVRLTTAVYRAHDPRWSWAPESGAGAELHGGRFNRGGVPALYTALDPMTAIREASEVGTPLQPLVLCQYSVDCHRMFDASDAGARAAEGVDDAMLACPTWERDMLSGQVPASQAVADRLIARGYCGLIVRSFAAGSTEGDLNAVFWRWSEEPPTMVRVIDDEGRLRRPPG
jgi:RES domain-containing protein